MHYVVPNVSLYHMCTRMTSVSYRASAEPAIEQVRRTNIIDCFDVRTTVLYLSISKAYRPSCFRSYNRGLDLGFSRVIFRTIDTGKKINESLFYYNNRLIQQNLIAQWQSIELVCMRS